MRTTRTTGWGLVFAIACSLLPILLLASDVFAQVSTTGKLTGIVNDATGAVVSRAQITIQNNNTKARFTVVANSEGEWTLPSVDNGGYTVTVTAPGFKEVIVQNVKVDVGQSATVNITLEVGAVGEQVVITGGGEVLQTSSARISSTITGREISELPFSTRDAMQLVLTMPGVQTPGVSRTSSVNGLPKSSLNITLDGANIQDNFLKSSDGFFTTTQPKSDAVEEVTVSTATPGAESAGGGAVQIQFRTRQGSSEFHGGLFWQHRNDAFNSNYYFNNIDGLPRDRIILNQSGGNIGGPILIPKLLKRRDKAFFFINVEDFRLPQTYGAARTVLTDDARQGIFTYRRSDNNAIQRVNLYDIARTGAGGQTYTDTPDPITARAYALVSDASKNGALRSRTETNNDYNRLNLNFQDPGRNIRRFPTVRLDFNLTTEHHLEFIHNFQHYFSAPDGVNGILAAFPGTGSVLGNPAGDNGSIYRNAFTFAMAERWTVRSNLVNEIRLTSSGNGTSLFRREFGPAKYALFNGRAITQLANPVYVSNFQTYTGTSRRNTPVKGLYDSLTWLKGSHEVNMGVSYTRVASFVQDAASALVPQIQLGIAANDPINTGTTSIFTTANFPGSAPAQRTEAANLYAMLTGRVSATTRLSTLNENTRKFAFDNANERNHQYELGLYAQDRWKVAPSLTLTGGLRWEFAPSPVNDNLVYTRTGLDGIFGVSGHGNLFSPGVYKGALTQFSLLEEGEKAFNNSYDNFAPSVGFAWTPNFDNGIFKRVFGDGGKTVLRGGYSIAYVREGFNAFTAMFGANDGVQIATGVSPGNFPVEFGPPGSRLLRDPLPFLPLPDAKFPLTARQGAPINDFNPNLRPGYTQSWTFGIQRELGKNTALEVRYVGNHGTRLWRQYEVGEVNIFENGFLDEFRIARENLRIARQSNPSSNNFGNQGLSGQRDIPIIAVALNNATNDQAFATTILRGEAGRLAANLAQNLERMTRLINSPLTRDRIKPITLPDPNNPGQTITLSNFFVANPRSPTNSWIMDNAGDSNYHALQVELRRRLSRGLLVQGSYVFSKSLTNMFASSDSAALTPVTMRDFDYEKGPAPRDNRHAFKFDYIYELPVGPGRAFLSGGPKLFGKLLESWQVAGVARIQSGTPSLLTSARQTFNQRESGVALHNITRDQLQDLVKIRKETVCDANNRCQGVIYWLPQAIIDNTLAAFELNSRALDPSKPYIGPPTTPGQLGARVFLYGPWTSRFDINLMKRTKITERTNFEFRVQFLNAFNQSGITIRAAGTNADSNAINATFGQTRNAFRDFTVSGTNDPGGRLIEFQLRLNF